MGVQLCYMYLDILTCSTISKGDILLTFGSLQGQNAGMEKYVKRKGSV